MTEREIPTYCFDFDYNEETEEYYIECPITGESIDDMSEYPEEFVMYYDNLSGIRHLNSWAKLVVEQCEEQNPRSTRDLIIENFIKDKPDYCLVVTHPEGEHSDFVELYYEGICPY